MKILRLTMCVVFSGIAMASHGHAQVAELAGTAATSVVIDQLFKELNNSIAKATERGDYLLARAGMEAKSAIESWEQANTHLLKELFKDLEKETRESFERAHQLASRVDVTLEKRLETAQQTVENSNQIVESIPLTGHKTYVLRYIPRIQPPTEPQAFRLRIRGVNLDRGNLQVTLPTGTILNGANSSALETEFMIPASALRSDKSKVMINALKLSYSTAADSLLWRILGSKDTATRELNIATLPEVYASYKFTSTLARLKKDSEPYKWEEQFSGKNENLERVAKPGDGWYWELENPKPVMTQHGGESGTCEAIKFDKSTKNGLVIQVRVDQVRRFDNGWVNCRVEGTRYKTTEEKIRGPAKEGSLSWLKDESIPLEKDTDNFELEVATFDNRTINLTGSATDKFFDVKRDPNRVRITPKIPDDLLR